MGDFDDLIIGSFILPDKTPYLMGDNSTWQPEKKRENSWSKEQDMTNTNDLKSELSEPPDELLEIISGNQETLCQFDQVWSP